MSTAKFFLGMDATADRPLWWDFMSFVGRQRYNLCSVRLRTCGHVANIDAQFREEKCRLKSSDVSWMSGSEGVKCVEKYLPLRPIIETTRTYLSKSIHTKRVNLNVNPFTFDKDTLDIDVEIWQKEMKVKNKPWRWNFPCFGVLFGQILCLTCFVRVLHPIIIRFYNL